MKLILVLRDEDAGLKSQKNKMAKRAAARAVLIKKSKIAMLYVGKHKYHKLPGGGVEKGETIKQALHREVLEETGCQAKIVAEIGKIVEHRTHTGTLQTSYCYIAEVTDEGVPDFDDGELKDGFKLKWVSMESAIKTLGKEKPGEYDGKFIVKRDAAFIKAAKKLIK